MSFLFPAVLGGLAAVSIPIAIHLLNKFRVRNIDWAAMRFLIDSVRKNERRLKIEDLILLLLRCLLVIVVVVAFARPVTKALLSQGDATGPVAAVVLLDNSASMLQSDGVETHFDEAKKAIREWLDLRDAHSLAALYLVSNRTEEVLAKPEPDFALFRKMLEIAPISDRGTDLAQGVRLAYQALKTVTGRPREIRIYTDDQTCAWSQIEDIRKLAQDNPDIHLKPVIIGKKSEDNLGILALSAEGGVPAARQPCRFRVEVGNYGATPAVGVRVSLSIDDGAIADEKIISQIAPGATETIDLLVNFPDPGYHVVTATIPPDALAIDNQRTAAVDVVSHMNVLVVEGGVAENTIDRDGYFLTNALMPLPREQAVRYYLGVTFAQPSGLDKAAITDCEAVFLCNPGNISPSAAQALHDYIVSGGNLVVFPGSRTDVEQWRQNTVWWDLLPAQLAAAKQSDNENKSITWQSSDFEHPITSLWNDPSQGDLGTVRFGEYFPLTPKPASPDEKKSGAGSATHGTPAVVVRFTNGDPSVVEWQYGAGRVVLFNSTATPEWNNLPLHPAFVPLMQRLMGYLNRKNETRLVLATGEPFRKTVPMEWQGKDFSVQGPGKDAVRRTVGQIESDGSQAVIQYSGTEKVGAYHVFVGNDLAAVFAVQLDPAESDLRRQDPTQIEALSLAQPPAGNTKVAATRMVVTQEFWTQLIWVTAAIVLLESGLAHYFSRAR